MLKNKLIVLSLSIFMVIACSGRLKKHIFSRPDEILKNKTLGIVPFHNLTQKIDAGVIMNHIIMTELIKNKNIKIAKYGDIYEALLKEHINAPATVDQKTLKMLRDTLGLDGVILGTLVIYKEAPERAEIRFDASLLDTETGQILWKGEFHKCGDTYSPIHLIQGSNANTALSLAKEIAVELVDSLGLESIQ
ncbi:MAG: hypothetical protein ACMUIP_00835 [bacterium]